jgi:hypothetical protein
MSALVATLRRWLGLAAKPSFAARLDGALADLDPISLRVEAWERSLPQTALDLEPHTDGRNV